MTRTGVTVAVLVASVVLLGCGGQDDEGASQPPPGGAAARKAPTKTGKTPTKPRFLRRADALCARAKRQVAPISRAVDAKIADQDAIGVAAELRKALPIADAFLARMRALTPPRGDEAIVGKYLTIVAEQKRRVRPMVEALEAEDISTIEVLAEELRQGNRRAQRLARQYGFANCGPAGLPTR